MDDLARELERLGDPSGRQDSSYWNDWFQVICRQQAHRAFEWYCSTDQVVCVVQHHHWQANKSHGSSGSSSTTQEDDTLPSRNLDNNGNEPPHQRCYAMIHPGSGTSLLPLALRACFPTSRQVVVDISSVALEEMKEIHDQQQAQNSKTTPTPPIEYVVADLLHNNDDDHEIENGAAAAGHGFDWGDTAVFDAWIDKGFVDAVFGRQEPENTLQSTRLFEKAARLLRPNTGWALVISLAEEHSLRIVLDNWLGHSCCCWWQPILHIWELRPISGDLPPFGFVLSRNANETESADETRESTFGLVLHRACRGGGSVEETHDLDQDSIRRVVQSWIETVRTEFLESSHGRTLDPSLPSPRPPPPPLLPNEPAPRRVLATIEVKPYDASQDLVALSQELLRHTDWWATTMDDDDGTTTATATTTARRMRPQPLWQPFSEHEPTTLFRIVPVAFGISKLLLKCIIASDDMDDLIEAIQAWDDDVIQSVDIDWTSTVPVSSVSEVVPKAV
jgi:translation elongation factor EF-1beta